MAALSVWRKFLNRLQLRLPKSKRPIKKRHPFQLEPLEDRAVPTTWYVATTGSDQNAGTNPNQPLLSIQLAVNDAASGDVIKVAAGTYGYNATDDVTKSTFGTTGVVAVTGKQITLLGGFTTSNFNTADASVNQTVINGNGTVRGVYVVTPGSGAATGLDIEGFTIQNGLGTPNPLRNFPDNVYGYGGGMLVDNGANLGTNAAIIVTNDIFQNDTAQGSNTTAAQESTTGGAGGDGAGGGFAIFGGTNTTLTNVTFQNDQAIGGTGPIAGGGALGGAFFATTSATVTGTNLTFTNDTATAGAGSGSGSVNGQTADALGGAIAVQNGSNVTFTAVTETGGTATGGAGGTASGDQAGSGFGGGAFVENALLTLNNSNLNNNTVQGGAGFTGGTGGGGGIETANANLVLNQDTLSQNTATAGSTSGGGAGGSADGGGLDLTRFQTGNFGSTLTITNTVIDDNTVQLASGGGAGGGGGGVYIQGAPVTITQSTIANNHLGTSLQNGYSILLIATNSSTPTSLNLNYDIVSNDANTLTNSPVTVQSGSTLTINRTLFVESGSPAVANGVNNGTVGTINFTNGASTDVITAPAADFVSPSSPNFNYELLASSPARNQAVGSTTTVDRAGNARSGDPTNPDLGAFEFVPPTVSFENLDNQTFKTSGQITVVVQLSEAVSTAVSVHYATSDGTAKAGTDYVATSGTLTFPAGVTSESFNVQVLNDGVQTGNLRLNLTLSNPVNVGLGAQTQAVVTIQDVFPTDNDAFISGLYHDLLGRAVDSSGLSFFLTPLTSAETPLLPGVLLNFVNSLGYYETLVGDPTTGFYAKYLGITEQPGSPDVAYWGNQLLNGATDEQVIAQFVSSQNYYTGKGQNSNLGWLQAAYQDILGRPLDSSGQAFYLPQLGSGGYNQSALQNVAMQLLTTTEYRTDLINSYFETYLNRPTNATDQQFWLSQFQAGDTDEQVITGIGGSLEGLLNNGGTNAKWITTLYQKTLGRAPNATELSFHLNLLENDAQTMFDNPYQLQRFYTAQAILNSSEFAASGTFSLAASLNTVISEVFTLGLGRSASASDIAYWSSQFVGDTNQNRDVAAAILSSGEFFNDAHPYP
jgi:Calx-beta domain